MVLYFIGLGLYDEKDITVRCADTRRCSSCGRPRLGEAVHVGFLRPCNLELVQHGTDVVLAAVVASGAAKNARSDCLGVRIRRAASSR